MLRDMDDQPTPQGPFEQPPVPPPPPAPAGWGETPPVPGAWGATPIATPAPPKRRLGLVVAVVVLGALAVVAIIALAGGSAKLPDTFAGADRVDSGEMEALLASVTDLDELGVDVELAMYGSDPLSPAYMIMVMEGGMVAQGGDLGDQFQQGIASGLGGQVDLSEAVEETAGGVDFVCVPATGAQFAAMGGRVGLCLYQEADRVVMVMSLQHDQLNTLMIETKELHAEIG